MTDATPPLSKDDAYRVIKSVAGTRSVLVGGQAVAWWAEVYPDEDIGASPYVSKDVDFLGEEQDARACAGALEGKLLVERNPFDSIAVQGAKVLFTDSRGYLRSVDFLANVNGIHPAEQIRLRAVVFEHDGGELYVMDPVTCLRSRIANISPLGPLGRTSAQSIEQARVAIRVARKWLVDPNGHPTVRDSLKWIETLFRYAHRHRDAQAVAIMPGVGVDAFDAITPDVRLPAKFRELRYPQMRALVTARRARGASGSGP